jgi:hypothetical protein
VNSLHISISKRPAGDVASLAGGSPVERSPQGALDFIDSTPVAAEAVAP